MNVWRKPASAQWYYESAQCVDEVEIKAEPWTYTRYIVFDVTKDKRGRRHTDLQLELSEADVEKLYQGLVKGRKAAMRRLDSLERKINKLAAATGDKYLEAAYGTDEKKVLRALWLKLREL